MSTLANEFTSVPGEYQLAASLIRNAISYPWAPTTTIQSMGGSVMDQNFMDVDSELKNITRPLTNNPQQKYIPGQEGKEQKMIHFDDGFFHQDSSRLRNNAFELKGVGINRWEPLFFDPQKNCIEPFNRNGINTNLLSLPDNSCFRRSLAANPRFFSSLSLVLVSGVFIPCSLIRFLTHTSNPISIKASTVSPSTILNTLALYSYILFRPHYLSVSIFIREFVATM